MDKFREECGVFGISATVRRPISPTWGLYALQHRGQKSAGIAASDGGQIRLRKAMGYVNEAFDATALAICLEILPLVTSATRPPVRASSPMLSRSSSTAFTASLRSVITATS